MRQRKAWNLRRDLCRIRHIMTRFARRMARHSATRFILRIIRLPRRIRRTATGRRIRPSIRRIRRIRLIPLAARHTGTPIATGAMAGGFGIGDSRQRAQGNAGWPGVFSLFLAGMRCNRRSLRQKGAQAQGALGRQSLFPCRLACLFWQKILALMA